MAAAPVKILIIEDEEDIRELLAYQLRRDGYSAFVTSDGYEGLAIARREHPEVILLDLMLPGLSGWDVCRQLRTDHAAYPAHIIIVSALTEEENMVRGLHLGADDYVGKPFRVREVMARVKAVQRRTPWGAPAASPRHMLTCPPLTLDHLRREVVLAGVPLVLTASEYRLLHLLMRHPECVFTRAQLAAAITGQGLDGGRNVDVHICSLRQKLGENAGLIDTVRGVGYRLRMQSAVPV